jgi:hypothetical protein
VIDSGQFDLITSTKLQEHQMSHIETRYQVKTVAKK